MKPRFRNLAAAFAPLSRTSLIVVASLCAAANAQAQTNGTWTGTAAGNWSDIANWSGGTIATGGGTADFSTIDVPAGALAVTVDSARDVSSLTFGDTDTGTVGTWTVGMGGFLTFSGARSVTTNVATTFTGNFGTQAATDVLTKLGSAELNLSGVGTAWAGPMAVSAGTVRLKGNSNSTATVVGALTGTGNVSVVQASGNTFTQASDISGFQGTYTCTIANFRYGSSSSLPGAAITNGSQATFDLGNGGNLFYRNGTNGTVTFRLGALTGSSGSFVSGGNSGGSGTVVFQLGEKNIDSTFGGVIRNGSTKSGISKFGTGILTLSGDNTYTGTTVITASSGTLRIGAGGTTGTLGSDGTTHSAVTVNTGSTLEFNRSNALSVPNVIGGAGTVKQDGTGVTTLAATNTFTTNLKINNGAVAFSTNLNLGAAANGVDFTGNGALAGTGTVSISRTLNLASGFTGTLSAPSASDAFTHTGLITGAGSLGVSGPGVVTLTGGTNDFSGTTTISSGTLDLENASGSATSTGAVAVSGGALAGNGFATGAVSVASAAALKPGTVTPSSSAIGTLTLGSLSLSGGSTLNAEFSSVSSYDKVVVNDLNGLTSSASLANPVLVDLRLVNTNAAWETLGTYDLIQYNGTFSGDPNDLFEVSPSSASSALTYTFTASGGFIKLTIAGTPPSEWNVDADGSWMTASNWNPASVPNSSGVKVTFGSMITAARTVTVASPVTAGTLSFDNANSYTVSGASPIALENGVDNAKVNILNGSHTVSTPVTFSDSVDMLFAGTTNAIAFDGNIDGAGGLSAVGSGTVSLKGTNTFSGAVSRVGGEIAFAAGGLGSGALSLDGSVLKWLPSNTEDISTKTITFAAGAVTFDTDANDVLLANAIGNGGTASFVKAGSGRLTLGANAAFTGATTISGGVLQLGSGGATGTLPGAITNNAELDVNLADGSSFGNTVSGTGSFVHAGTGSLTLSSANTFTGTTTIPVVTASLVLSNSLALQGSTLQYDTAGSPSPTSGGTLGFGTLTAATFGGLAGNKNLTLENSTPAAVALTIGGNNVATTYSGALSGSGSLVKAGTAITTLTGASTYAGATTVNGGQLDLSTGGSINGGALTVGGSGKMVVSDGSLTVPSGNLFVNSGGLLVTGGTATISGALNASGSNGSSNSAPIKVTGGTLSAGSIQLGRTGENLGADPGAGTADRNLYITGGAVSLSGTLQIGTASAQPNSSVITRIDGGSLTVSGAISIGLVSPDRWSILDVNGGDLVSTDTVSGVILGSSFVGTTVFTGNSTFVVRSGTATVERIQFGQTTVGGAGSVKLLGGTLYMGSGGFNLGTTGTYAAEIRLAGGTLAAKAPWTTSFPINVAGTSHSVVKAADANDNPFDITLNGALTGTGSLDKEGTGTLTLGGVHSYTGTTTVYAGILKVKTRTFDDNAFVDVQPGATLNLDFAGGDRIGSLRVDGTDYVDPGTYGAVGSGATTELAGLTGSGLLYIGIDPPASAYDTWASAKGLTVGVNDGPNDDPDNDGVENQLEFVLGGDPLASSTGVLPTLSVTPTSFIFSFTRNDDSEAEVALAFEHGNDLSGWTPIAIGTDTAGSGAGVVVGENAADPDTVTVTISRGTESKIFGRLRAVK